MLCLLYLFQLLGSLATERKIWRKMLHPSSPKDRISSRCLAFSFPVQQEYWQESTWVETLRILQVIFRQEHLRRWDLGQGKFHIILIIQCPLKTATPWGDHLHLYFYYNFYSLSDKLVTTSKDENTNSRGMHFGWNSVFQDELVKKLFVIVWKNKLLDSGKEEGKPITSSYLI